MFSYYQQEKLDRERDKLRTAAAEANNPKKLARYLSKKDIAMQNILLHVFL